MAVTLPAHPEEDTPMADPPPYRDPKGDTGVGPDRGSTSGTPRWVKVFGIVALVVILLVVIMLLTGGNHGPGRHTGGRGGPAPAAAFAAHDLRLR
jgi:hypothetical protein